LAAAADFIPDTGFQVPLDLGLQHVAGVIAAADRWPLADDWLMSSAASALQEIERVRLSRPRRLARDRAIGQPDAVTIMCNPKP